VYSKFPGAGTKTSAVKKVGSPGVKLIAIPEKEEQQTTKEVELCE